MHLILSSPRHSLNKTELDFKSSRAHSKEVNRKKRNCLIYKCSHCNKFGHLETFFYKLKRYKDSNPRTSRTTNAPESKTIWIYKVKP